MVKVPEERISPLIFPSVVRSFSKLTEPLISTSSERKFFAGSDIPVCRSWVVEGRRPKSSPDTLLLQNCGVLSCSCGATGVDRTRLLPEVRTAGTLSTQLFPGSGTWWAGAAEEDRGGEVSQLAFALKR